MPCPLAACCKRNERQQVRQARKQLGSHLGELKLALAHTVAHPFSAMPCFLWHSIMQNVKWSAPRDRCAEMNHTEGS